MLIADPLYKMKELSRLLKLLINNFQFLNLNIQWKFITGKGLSIFLRNYVFVNHLGTSILTTKWSGKESTSSKLNFYRRQFPSKVIFADFARLFTMHPVLSSNRKKVVIAGILNRTGRGMALNFHKKWNAFFHRIPWYKCCGGSKCDKRKSRAWQNPIFKPSRFDLIFVSRDHEMRLLFAIFLEGESL